MLAFKTETQIEILVFHKDTPFLFCNNDNCSLHKISKFKLSEILNLQKQIILKVFWHQSCDVHISCAGSGLPARVELVTGLVV